MPKRAKPQDGDLNLITVSSNLLRDMVDTVRDLARKRADDVRAARAQGKALTGDARQAPQQDRPGCAGATYGAVEEGVGAVKT